MNSETVEFIAAHRDELPSPLYLYSESALTEAVQAYRRLFPDKARIFYSLKANPQPGIVRHLVALGIGAEITGQGELEISRAAGSPCLLAGGVSKSEAFLTALYREQPAAVIIESEAEWERLKKTAPNSASIPVLLRINPGRSFGGLNMAGGSQFGLSPDQALAVAEAACGSDTVDFLGLHFYFGSQRLDPDPILQALEAAEEILSIFRKAGLKIKVVDLGLGCGVPYLERDKALDMSALGKQLRLLWQKKIWSCVEIWAEAGRALVAGAGCFIARVTERKRLHGKTFIFLDGGLNVHNPGVGLGRFFRGSPIFSFLPAVPGQGRETVSIVGNLCTSADCFAQDIEAPRLEEGDLVVINNAGAYCQTTALWGFNSQPRFHEALLSADGTLTMLEAQHSL